MVYLGWHQSLQVLVFSSVGNSGVRATICIWQLQAWQLSVKTQISAAVKLPFRRGRKMSARKRYQWHKREKKGKHRFLFRTEYLRNVWSTFTCGPRPSQSRHCEHSRLLLLLRAGNRHERSHSYTLLCYVSAKKKQMLRKFWMRIWKGGGGLNSLACS